MSLVLDWFLSRFVRAGSLEVRFPDGARRRYGDGSGPQLAISINDEAAERALTLNPRLTLGELYMDSRLDLVEGDLYDLVALGASNARSAGEPAVLRVLERSRLILESWAPFNDRNRSRENVAHHYDLDERFYGLFLDDDLQYSCAYFETWGQSLEAAQLAKKRHIGAKLLVEPGHRTLDIGCGFGGMALYLAQVAGPE